MTDIKLEVYKRNKKLKDLSEALSMSYSMLSRVLNGFQSPKVNFKFLVRKVLKNWDAE